MVQRYVVSAPREIGMSDLLVLKRMNEMIAAIDKMHNGLLALIDAHHKLEQDLDERIKKLEEQLKKDG